MERILEILKILNNSQGFVLTNDLALEFNVTTRTIRNDLSILEEILQGSDVSLIKKKNLGVSLSKRNMDENKLYSLIGKVKDSKDFYSSVERENLIIETLLLSEEAVTTNQLEEITLSSKSSLIRNLANCEKKLAKQKIQLVKKPRTGISIACSEYNRRMAVLEHIMSYVETMDFKGVYHNLINMRSDSVLVKLNSFMNFFLQDINTIYISNFIKRYESDNNVKFTDEAFISILFYICIAYKRINQGHFLKQNDFVLNKFFKEESINSLIDKNIIYLNKGLDNEFNRFESEAILIYMLSQKQFSKNGFTQNDLMIEDELFNEKSHNIVKQFIHAVQNYLNVDLINDQTLLNNLLLHIKPTIFRLLFGIQLTNPLKNDIKMTYPEVFAACKKASEIISSKTNNTVDDDEISYLAIHIEASIEKSKAQRFVDFYNVLIVCPEGNGTSSILYYRLLNSFPNIQIEHICSIGDFNKINKENIDLIISTVPIYDRDRFNIIHVNPLLYDNDIAKIRRAMKRISLSKNSATSLVVDDLLSIVSKYASIFDYENLRKDTDKYFSPPPAKFKQSKIFERIFTSVFNFS